MRLVCAFSVDDLDLMGYTEYCIYAPTSEDECWEVYDLEDNGELDTLLEEFEIFESYGGPGAPYTRVKSIAWDGCTVTVSVYHSLDV